MAAAVGTLELLGELKRLADELGCDRRLYQVIAELLQRGGALRLFECRRCGVRVWATGPSPQGWTAPPDGGHLQLCGNCARSARIREVA